MKQLIHELHCFACVEVTFIYSISLKNVFLFQEMEEIVGNEGLESFNHTNI